MKSRRILIPIITVISVLLLVFAVGCGSANDNENFELQRLLDELARLEQEQAALQQEQTEIVNQIFDNPNVPLAPPPLSGVSNMVSQERFDMIIDEVLPTLNIPERWVDVVKYAFARYGIALSTVQAALWTWDADTADTLSRPFLDEIIRELEYDLGVMFTERQERTLRYQMGRTRYLYLWAIRESALAEYAAAYDVISSIGAAIFYLEPRRPESPFFADDGNLRTIPDAATLNMIKYELIPALNIPKATLDEIVIDFTQYGFEITELQAALYWRYTVTLDARQNLAQGIIDSIETDLDVFFTPSQRNALQVWMLNSITQHTNQIIRYTEIELTPGQFRNAVLETLMPIRP